MFDKFLNSQALCPLAALCPLLQYPLAVLCPLHQYPLHQYPLAAQYPLHQYPLALQWHPEFVFLVIRVRHFWMLYPIHHLKERVYYHWKRKSMLFHPNYTQIDWEK